jgi:hypothetical protein
VSFNVLFVCICVLYYCHQVATQLQLNISYIIHHIISYIIVSYHISYHTVSYHIIPYIISYIMSYHIISNHIISYYICSCVLKRIFCFERRSEFVCECYVPFVCVNVMYPSYHDASYSLYSVRRLRNCVLLVFSITFCQFYNAL